MQQNQTRPIQIHLNHQWGQGQHDPGPQELQGEEQQGDHNAEPASQGGADVGGYDVDGEDREHVANPAANLGYSQVIQFVFR